MSAAIARSPSPPQTVDADGGPTLLERQLAMLDELAEIAMEVAFGRTPSAECRPKAGPTVVTLLLLDVTATHAAGAA